LNYVAVQKEHIEDMTESTTKTRFEESLNNGHGTYSSKSKSNILICMMIINVSVPLGLNSDIKKTM
jgi:hypothetical protein